MDFMKKKRGILVFCGNPGIGKTHFCASLTRWALESFNCFRYYKEADLLKRLRESMEGVKGDYLDVLATLIDDDLIILDDVGSQGVNEWRAEIFFNTIDDRYNSTKPTIVTSNLTKHEFAIKYHERVMSRLFASENIIIELHNGPDLRKEGM